MGIIWTLIIGFLAGVIAKHVMPGYSKPPGVSLATTLGTLGAIGASILGMILGWFSPDQGVGIVGAAFGAMVALAGWDYAQKRP